uniref:Uncharacterized protein n=1 Tax=Oryza rufipogon TaxID=4529 RepID=A0A0E0NT50_ORYRU
MPRTLSITRDFLYIRQHISPLCKYSQIAYLMSYSYGLIPINSKHDIHACQIFKGNCPSTSNPQQTKP